MSLFQEGAFPARSGQLPWKIECDALTDADWEWAATRVAEKYWIRYIRGIPSGGMKFATALAKHQSRAGEVVLIVDDVLTTGGSMEDYRRRCVLNDVPCIGIVMFARIQPAAWIKPIWQLWGP